MKYLPAYSLIILIIISSGIFSCNPDSREKDDKAEKARSETSKEQPEKKATRASERKTAKKASPDKKTDISVDTILGRWIRPDGNYMLGINDIKEDNKIEATYHNPSPINVAVAELKAKDPVKLYIEFDDENYRGSYYDLEYDPSNDVLQGSYFQATYGQTYHIAFIRMQDQ